LAVRIKGKISSWIDKKGYGFISPMAGGGRVFVHIKAFANRSRRPAVGDTVTYSMSTDVRGRPCAKEAAIAGFPKTAKPRHSSSVLPHAMAVGFFLVVFGAVFVSAIPIPILLFYLIVSLATFVAYALDKSAAGRGGWRTSENTLHLLAVAGGWPGALIAQSRLRHKSKKQPFRAVFWATVVLNCAAFFWLFTPEGERAWRLIVSAIT
jgi:uncharacterized membrane protein YsdA (DUF1294 family)/cold shock CspA family protein